MGLIARTVSSRVVDELSVRLAGATENAIEEIVRRRSDAIKTAVEVERLRHPDAAPQGPRAPARLPAQQAVGDRRGASRRCRAPSRAWARRPRSAPAWPTRSRSCTRRWRSSWPSPRPSTTTSTRTTSAPPTCASCSRSTPARRSSASAASSSSPTASALDPHDRALSEELNRELGAMVVKRTARRRVAHAARPRDPVRRRRRDRRGRELQGHAPHGPHGTALLRVHRRRHSARLSVRRRAPRHTAPGLRLARDRDRPPRLGRLRCCAIARARGARPSSRARGRRAPACERSPARVTLRDRRRHRHRAAWTDGERRARPPDRHRHARDRARRPAGRVLRQRAPRGLTRGLALGRRWCSSRAASGTTATGGCSRTCACVGGPRRSRAHAARARRRAHARDRARTPTAPPPTRSCERRARRAARGLWGACSAR